MSSHRGRRALEKQIPEETSPIQVEEQENTELHVANADDDGFSDDVDEPLACKRLDPVAKPCVA